MPPAARWGLGVTSFSGTFRTEGKFTILLVYLTFCHHTLWKNWREYSYLFREKLFFIVPRTHLNRGISLWSVHHPASGGPKRDTMSFVHPLFKISTYYGRCIQADAGHFVYKRCERYLKNHPTLSTNTSYSDHHTYNLINLYNCNNVAPALQRSFVCYFRLRRCHRETGYSWLVTHLISFPSLFSILLQWTNL